MGEYLTSPAYMFEHSTFSAIFKDLFKVKWMVDAEPEDHAMLLENRTLAAEILPHYFDLLSFAEGRIRAFEFTRQQKQAKGGKDVSGRSSQIFLFEIKVPLWICGGLRPHTPRKSAATAASEVVRTFWVPWRQHMDSWKIQKIIRKVGVGYQKVSGV